MAPSEKAPLRPPVMAPSPPVRPVKFHGGGEHSLLGREVGMRLLIGGRGDDDVALGVEAGIALRAEARADGCDVAAVGETACPGADAEIASGKDGSAQR